MGYTEQRIEEMHRKADERTAKLNAEAQTETDTERKNRLAERAEKVQERADNRAKRIENTAKWWEAMRQAFDPSAPLPAYTEDGEKEQKGESAPTTATTPTPPQANVGGAPTTATTPTKETDEGVAIKKEELTPEDKFRKAVEESIEANERIAKEAESAKVKRYKETMEEISKGQSAYQSIFRKALHSKENVALRQERDARTKALINAFGSLVNVLTAGVIAKKGDHIPIISAYDKEPDTALRKAIEGRYAIENENENLLLKLEQERHKHEADLALAQYKFDAGLIDDKARRAAEAAQARADAEGRIATAEIRARDRKEFDDYSTKNNIEEKNAQGSKNGSAKGKTEPTPEENDFNRVLFRDLQKKTERTNAAGFVTSSTSSDYAPSPNDMTLGAGMLKEAKAYKNKEGKRIPKAGLIRVAEYLNFLYITYGRGVTITNEMKEAIYNGIINGDDDDQIEGKLVSLKQGKKHSNG